MNIRTDVTQEEAHLAMFDAMEDDLYKLFSKWKEEGKSMKQIVDFTLYALVAMAGASNGAPENVNQYLKYALQWSIDRWTERVGKESHE